MLKCISYCLKAAVMSFLTIVAPKSDEVDSPRSTSMNNCLRAPRAASDPVTYNASMSSVDTATNSSATSILVPGCGSIRACRDSGDFIAGEHSGDLSTWECTGPSWLKSCTWCFPLLFFGQRSRAGRGLLGLSFGFSG